MKKSILLITLLAMVSCEDYTEELAEMVGFYSASIVGDSQVFDMVVSLENGDNINIESFFDGEYWDEVSADVDCEYCEIKRIAIVEQLLEEDVYISGEGYYSEGTIQLDYTISVFDVAYDYTLVGSR